MAWITGNNNAQTLSGTTTADIIFGYGGNDSLFGRAGNDSLYGGYGNDMLNGGSGDDVICGGVGADFLIGGLGRDVFRFTGATDTKPNDSLGVGDVIGDFRRGEDVIKFTNISQKTVIQTLEADGDLVIKYGSLGGQASPYQGTITLEQFGQYLGYSDFVFA